MTLRIVNGGNDPIYVDTTTGKLGLTIQRDVGGTLYPFDDLACECRSCDRVCDPSCTCPAVGPDLIRRVAPGESAERVWDGVVRVAGLTSCGDGTCLSGVNAPLNEPFTLELCFSTQKPQGLDFSDGGMAEGQLPKSSLTCVTKRFEPGEGVVEIGPARGSACTSHSQCLAAGELCLGGSCTSGCPPNAFPGWSVYVASPDDMDFLTPVTRPRGSGWTGTGTLSAFLYAGEKLELHFSHGDAGVAGTASIQVTLPPMTGAPLQAGSKVTLLVVDDGQSRPGRAFSLRDATTGALLLAADMGYGEPLLDSADLSPVIIAPSSELVGCRQDGCGKLLFTRNTFSAEGKTLELEPGETGELSLSGGLYRFVNVSSGTYASTRCDYPALRPWVLWRQAPP
ncbi:MAG: hypothetical protein AB1938_22650 [Myxococcota bacterium]